MGHHSDLTSVMVLSHLEDTALQPSSPDSDSDILCPFPQCSLSLGWAAHGRLILYTLTSCQSVLTYGPLQKKLLWWRLRTASLYGHQRDHLEYKLRPCLFSRTTVVPPQPQALDGIYNISLDFSIERASISLRKQLFESTIAMLLLYQWT